MDDVAVVLVIRLLECLLAHNVRRTAGGRRTFVAKRELEEQAAQGERRKALAKALKFGGGH